MPSCLPYFHAATYSILVNSVHSCQHNKGTEIQGTLLNTHETKEKMHLPTNTKWNKVICCSYAFMSHVGDRGLYHNYHKMVTVLTTSHSV